MAATHPQSRDTYLTAAFLAFIVIAQATLFSRVRVFGASPDLLLVAVVCWSLARGVGDGLVWSFGGGLGVDLVAGLPLGTSSLALLPLPWLGGLGHASIFGSSGLLPALLVMLATPLRGWIMLLLQQAADAHVDWIASTVRVIGPELVLNALLAVITYPLVRWLAASLNPRTTERV